MKLLTSLTAGLALTCGTGAAIAQDISAQGNEPFWRAEVELMTFTLTRPDAEPLVLSVTDRAAMDGGGEIITAMTTSPALRAVLTLSPGPCSDTMADQTYPFDATVEMGDMTLSGCGGDPAELLTAADPWMVTSIAGAAVLPETEVTMTFGEGDALSGSGGCNRYTALYEITGEGVSIGSAAATRMACPDDITGQEQVFLAALEAVRSFDIAEDGSLLLIGPDGPIIEASAP